MTNEQDVFLFLLILVIGLAVFCYPTYLILRHLRTLRQWRKAEKSRAEKLAREQYKRAALTMDLSGLMMIPGVRSELNHNAWDSRYEHIVVHWQGQLYVGFKTLANLRTLRSAQVPQRSLVVPMAGPGEHYKCKPVTLSGDKVVDSYPIFMITAREADRLFLVEQWARLRKAYEDECAQNNKNFNGNHHAVFPEGYEYFHRLDKAEKQYEILQQPIPRPQWSWAI